MIRRELVGGAALVTGASSGIGRAICHHLAERQVRVLLIGRDPTRTEEARRSLSAPDRHRAAIGDLTDDTFISTLRAAVDEFAPQGLSVLVCSAARIDQDEAGAPSLESFDAQLLTNLRAPFALTTTLLPALRRARGQIVFLNSSAVNNPRPEFTGYTASKAGLRALADCLRAGVNADGVRVLSVFPGRTATPMQQGLVERDGRVYQPHLLLQPEDVASSVLAALELPETAELTELHIRPNIKS